MSITERLTGQIGRPPRFISTLTSLSQLERGACTFSTSIAPRVHSLPLAGSRPTKSGAFSVSIPTQPPPPRISVRSPRFISISTTASITSDLETEVTSMSLSRSMPSSTPPILDLSTAVKETASEFHRLFPDQPRKTLDQLTREHSRDHAPWRNQTMQPGSALEEALRKAVYQRDPISVWWPMYDELSTPWANHHSGESTLTRTDFVRLIAALKVSQHPARVQRLERLFEDFHLVIYTQKSNVRVYTTFLETIQFWKMQELVPLWIRRIRSKIVLPTRDSSPSTPSVLPSNSLVRESPQEQFHDLMRVLANVDLMEPLLDCLQELKMTKSDLLMPSTKAYDTILEVYMRRKNTAQAMQLVQEMKDHGLPPQLTTFNILLNAHLENKDARAAQRVLESLLLTDLKPDIYTFNVLMAGYLNMGEFEFVNGFYKGLAEYGLVPNSKTYRILLKSHLKQGHVKQVVDLFCQLKESPRPELHPGSEDYRILIQALAGNGKMPEALKVLQEMIDGKKVPVTTWIYNVFLTQYARQGQVDKARRILDRIIAEKLPLVDGSINPLIRAYLARKDLHHVAEMTDLLTRYGIQPSSTTFNIMINSTKASGNLDGAMKLYERMESEGVAPDVWTYNTLLDILVGKLVSRKGTEARKGGPNAQDPHVEEYIPKIETLLQDMKSKGIKPNATTYGKLIHQYVILQNMEQAEMLFHEMVKSGISPNSYVFNTLMNGFTTMEEMDKAVELFRRMPKYGVEPDATSFTTLVKGYASMQELKLAQNFANTLQLRSSKIKLDQFCFHTLMQLAQKSHQPGMALDFFEMMRGRGIEADHYTFTILLNALSRDLAGANSSSSSRPKRRGSRKIESGLAPESTTEAVESILSMIQQDSQALNHAQITTVLSAYFRLGRPQAAIEFFKTRYWKSEPKLNTTNCGALFHGLLAPEHNRRYDGIVLNLYSKMLSVTRDLIRAEEEHKRRLEELKVSDDDSTTATSAAGGSESKLRQMGDWSGPRGPWADSSTSSSSPSRTLSRPSSPSLSSSSSSRPPLFAPRYDLPPVDLILISIMFQSFSQRQNWGIVLQLWQDVESIGVDQLYPFRMPLEFLGWAAEAFHRTSDPSNNTRRHVSSTTSADQEQQHHQHAARDSEAQREEKAGELLKRLWNAHDRMGVQWSHRIYGFNMFESLTPSLSTSSSAPLSGSGWDSQPSPSAPASELSHFLSGVNGQSYGRPSSDAKASSPTSENASDVKDEEEEPKIQGWHRL
ncbi:hypothetical protein BGZ92_001591 [Podila epicladia]|nr:hypothetical protein BGZ92_001591 [Podila epicladia]